MQFKLVEAVPNFSEGRNQKTIDELASIFMNQENVYLLDIDINQDANRSVFTIVGDLPALEKSIFQAFEAAARLIDMSQHHGVHPRIGAVDVCPFIPLKNSNMEDCCQLTYRLSKMIWEKLKIPSYWYGEAAKKLQRKNLANCRSGEYEKISEKLQKDDWYPDCGEPVFNRKSGLSIIGARNFLLAYNINLAKATKEEAQKIAGTIRESGVIKRDSRGNKILDENKRPIRKNGLLKNVKAIGWFLDNYQIAQVSTNILNFRKTSIFKVFSTVLREAKKMNLEITGSELIGLAPLEALLKEENSLIFDHQINDQLANNIIELGLNDLVSFDPKHKILEYNLAEKGFHEI